MSFLRGFVEKLNCKHKWQAFDKFWVEDIGGTWSGYVYNLKCKKCGKLTHWRSH